MAAAQVDAVFHPGSSGMPLILFIHGMGMDHTTWTDPGKARVLGGKYPLSILLAPGHHESSFHDLRARGYPVLTWSQSRPVGPAAVAEEELKALLDAHRHHARNGIILVGHSRGGLIARRFLKRGARDVRAVITIAAPHRGSSLARWVAFLEPLGKTVKALLDAKQGSARTAMQRVVGFLCSEGVQEMLPGSDYLKGLDLEKPKTVACFSLGGTDPSLVRINGESLPHLLSAILPDKLIPAELREGLGDGMVSSESSVYPNGDAHGNLSAHHAAILYHEEARQRVVDWIAAF